MMTTKVEQPGSSLLKESPYYVHLLMNCGPAFFKRTWLGLYGHFLLQSNAVIWFCVGVLIMLNDTIQSETIKRCYILYIYIYIYMRDDYTSKQKQIAIVQAPIRPWILDLESHMTKEKRDELNKSSQGMVKKTISKKRPGKVWVTLGHKFYMIKLPCHTIPSLKTHHGCTL